MPHTLEELEEGRTELNSGTTSAGNPNHASSCDNYHKIQVAYMKDENGDEVSEKPLPKAQEASPEVKPSAPHSKEAEVGNVPSSSIAKGWQHLVKIFKKRDDDTIKDYDEEINTLLVFAGLFSAVLTAFIIDAYKRLEEDSAEMSVLILRRISIQLEGSSSIPPMPPPRSDYSPNTIIIAVNLLWFSSLLLSLFTALFGILAKQWIHVYNKWSEGDKSEDMLFLRYFYQEGFEESHVSEIIGALPVFLQLALLLFAAGLVTYLWTLNRVVAIFTTTMTSSMVLIALYTILLPVFRAKCAYKTPLVLFLATLRERKVFLAYLSYAMWMFLFVLFTFFFVLLAIFFFFLKMINFDAGMFDWICNTGNKVENWMLKKPSSNSHFPSRWRDLDSIRAPKLSFDITSVDNVIKHANLILDVRPQSKLEELLDRKELDGTVAALKINELDEPIKELLFELCLPPLLDNVSEANRQDWRTAQYARRMRCLLDFVDRTQGRIIARKIRAQVVQRYSGQSTPDERIKAANLYREIAEGLLFKPDENDVDFYLRSLIEVARTMEASQNASSDTLPKVSAVTYHELWTALYLWLELSRRCEFTSSPDLIQKCQDLLKDLSNVHLAEFCTQPSFFMKHTPYDSPILFSPNGSVILTWDTSEVNNNAILVWDAATGENNISLRGHTGLVRTVVFSPDGSHVATGSNDHTGIIWNVASGEPDIIIRGYKGSVCAAAFSPNGAEVAMGSEDETADIWDSATGGYVGSIGSYLDPIISLAFSSDGQQIVLGLRDGFSKLEHRSVSKRSRMISGSFSGNGIRELVFSADGLYLLITRFDDETFEIWSTVTGKQIFCVDGHSHPLVSVIFSSDGRHIISRDAHGLTRIWNTLDYIPHDTIVTSPSPPIFMLDRQTRIMVAKDISTNQVVPVYCIPDDEDIPDQWIQDSSGYKVAFRLGSGRIAVIDSEPVFTHIADLGSTEAHIGSGLDKDQKLRQRSDEEPRLNAVAGERGWLTFDEEGSPSAR